MKNAGTILNGKSNSLLQAFIEKARYSIVFGLLGTILFYCRLLHKVLKATPLLTVNFDHHLCRSALHCANLMVWLS